MEIEALMHQFALLIGQLLARRWLAEREHASGVDEDNAPPGSRSSGPGEDADSSGGPKDGTEDAASWEIRL
jgi:hypothetical protein